MCGIIAVSCSATHNRSLSLAGALEAIAHRGPDGSGTYVSERGDCHLGHRRLAIIDVSDAGRQPMTDASGRFVLTYNGEVYNYRDLKAGLEQRHGPIRWKSTSDTEVILEGVAREGVDFLGRLNGIFALAVYDAQERLLHVLRDPVGIKPLVVTGQMGDVFFASELKGLCAIEGVRVTLRRQSLADQLAFMYVPEPHTMYNEVRHVEPGTCCSYRDGRLVRERALFGHLNEPIELASQADAIERLRELFAAAVQRQLVADVPISLFLSGGLDSSAVAHEAARHGAKIKDAYTISFSSADRARDAQSDDLHYARLMAGRLGLDLRIIEAAEDFIGLLPRLVGSMEDGFTDPAAINTYLIAARAREAGVKVMLSGQGADEHLGGYRRYQAERLLQQLPPGLRAPLSRLGRMTADRLPAGRNALKRRIARLGELAGQLPPARRLGMFIWTPSETIDELLPDSGPWSGGDKFQALFECHDEGDALAALMKVDQHYDLRSLNLCYTDRMSMAASIEARVPFLDFELVRLMNAIPSRWKVKGRQGKYVLKKAMEPVLPREVVYREKAGFGLPIRAWLQNKNAMIDEFLDEGRLRRQGLFGAGAVRRIIDEQRSGTRDRANTLFTLLCQQLWLDARSSNVRANAPASRAEQPVGERSVPA